MNNLPYDPFNPDFCGYPHEQDDWYIYVDADEKYQAEQQELDRVQREAELEQALKELEAE